MQAINAAVSRFAYRERATSDHLEQLDAQALCPQGPTFAAPKAIRVPPASSYLTSAQLALTVASAVPMLMTVQYAARPEPGVSDDAAESERNLPRQADVGARQDRAAVTRAMVDAQPALLRQLTAAHNLQWLAPGFQLILGAGFFGMYQHAGVLRALAAVGLHDSINELCGLSSGAITGAIYATLGPDGMTEALLNLSLVDFLDLSPTKFVREGALCAGKAVERKIAAETGKFGCKRIEDAPGAALNVAVFDGFRGRTVWHTKGPLAQTVAQSAALPVLFANDGYFDGGWVDHHGFTALRPGKRALSVRMNTGLEPDTMQKLVHRPKPLFNVSDDAEHETVALKPLHKVDGKTFLLDIDFRKQKLVDIIRESEEMFTWWLYQPKG